MPEFTADFRAQLLDLFKWRRDVRQFKRDPLPQGTFERLVSIASLAPSVGLSEPWRFVLVESDACRVAVRECFNACNKDALGGYSGERAALYAQLKLEGLSDAPCQFALFVEPATAQGHGLGRQTMPVTIEYSAVAAVTVLWLAARAEGIGVGWVSILDPAEVAGILDVPPGWTMIGYFCLGYPSAESPSPTLETEGWEYRSDSSASIIRR
ncbi:MAG: 5,6-dimethylbenzimidazole synthase [Xanthobacteraceae bacterium]|nr:5,6-dimethylbenzimidazole synthase [Xanthobacteraceae bacterium]